MKDKIKIFLKRVRNILENPYIQLLPRLVFAGKIIIVVYNLFKDGV